MAHDTAITPARHHPDLGSMMRANLDGKPIIELTSLDDFDR